PENIFGEGAGTNLIKVTYQLANRGTKALPATVASVVLSARDFTADATDPIICNIAVPALSPWTVVNTSVNCAVPSTWPVGESMLELTPDSTHLVAEAIENDIRWGFVGIGPDLKATTVTASNVARTVTITVTTKNIGTAAIGASTTGMYLTSDGYLFGTEPLL